MRNLPTRRRPFRRQSAIPRVRRCRFVCTQRVQRPRLPQHRSAPLKRTHCRQPRRVRLKGPQGARFFALRPPELRHATCREAQRPRTRSVRAPLFRELDTRQCLIENRFFRGVCESCDSWHPSWSAGQTTSCLAAKTEIDDLLHSAAQLSITSKGGAKREPRIWIGVQRAIDDTGAGQ